MLIKYCVTDMATILIEVLKNHTISKLCSIPRSVMSAGTTDLTGKPARVSSFPITNI